MHKIPKLIGHSESGAKRNAHSNKYLHTKILDISYQQFKSTPENFRTKIRKHVQEMQTAGNKQTEGLNKYKENNAKEK